MRSIFAHSLVALMSLGVMTVSQVANASGTATPVVVYGNEGLGDIHVLPLAGVIVDENVALAVGSNVDGLSHSAIAQGIRTGGKACDLSSVDLGLYMRFRWPSLDIALYSSVNVNGLDMPGERLKAFVTTPTNGPFIVDGAGVYNFAFDASAPTYRLQPNTNYWIVLTYTPQNSDQPTFYWNSSNANQNYAVAPLSANDSMINYLGTVARHGFAEDWKDHGPNVTAFNTTPQACLRISLYGVLLPPDPPVLDCYALSKGFFRNKYPSGWPASVIYLSTVNGNFNPDLKVIQIGGRFYSINELRIMLATNSTGGNQLGQLASQLVAVYLSRELAKQTAGPDYTWWDGWAPNSADAQTAFDQAAELINSVADFDSYGRLTGRVTGVSNLISILDGYITANHCGSTSNGSTSSGQGDCNDDEDDGKKDDDEDDGKKDDGKKDDGKKDDGKKDDGKKDDGKKDDGKKDDQHKNCKKDSKGNCMKKKDGGCR